MKKLSISLAIAAVAGLASAANAALADGGAKFLGNITTNSQIRSDMGTYWNQITNENGCKWGSIHSVDNSGKSKFNFNGFDSCENGYKWAKEKPGERHFKFHALIWGSQKPDFLCTAKNPGITVEKTKQYIIEWFDAVAAKFPDLEYIDVVNEAIWAGNNYHSGYNKPANGAEGISTDDPSCGGTYIIDALGGDRVVNGKHQYDFVKTAFEMARERWPEAKLIYNDYNTLSWQMNEGIEMIQTLLANGAPIDFYGQQAHDCKGMSKSDFESKLTRIHNETGLPLLISEYDIGEADDQKQKNDYANQIPFMWETEWIGGITIWGYINGATWAANTGIMESNGSKRAAMVWLEDYFAKNLDKGKNTTGSITKIEPEPQTPFKGVAFDLSAKIEAEDFDIPGKGRNEDGTSNNSYSVSGQCNDTWNTEYRAGTSVSIGEKNGGLVLGCNPTGNSFEYTINVAEGGTFDIAAMVAAEGDGALVFKVGDKVVSDSLKYSGSSWTTFEKVAGSITLEKGEQILTMEVAKGYIDIDWFQISKAGEAAIGQKLQLDRNTLQDYYVFDMQGVRLGILSAYGFDAAAELLKTSSAVKSSGIYYLRSRTTGKMQSVRIAK
ncbi:endo-1,4-beta-xylanase [Fibrobacter sp.]|uniref:endo-1,4-beta-xylanase n=1 Tax=Fibrobacter sp. TaxID=35828 RepID=UPI003862F9D4